jgi:hypothetical protein
MFVASAITWICHRISIQPQCKISWTDPGFLLVETTFFLTSRDTLRKYHERTQQLLSAQARAATVTLEE